MGTEAIWIPAVVAAVGAGASYYNTTQTAKRQDNELTRQIMAQGQRNRQADSAVSEAILAQQGSNPEAERQKASDAYLERLRRTRPNANAGFGQIGAVSDRFADSAQDAANDIDATGAQTADIYSRMDAPLRQRQNEGVAFGRLGSEIGRIGLMSDSDAYLSDLRMRSIRRNPWIDAAAGAAGMYASGYQPSSAAAGSTAAAGFGNNMDNFMRTGWGG